MNERVRPLLVQDGCTRRSSRLFYGIDDPGFAVHTINDCRGAKTETRRMSAVSFAPLSTDWTRS